MLPGLYSCAIASTFSSSHTSKYRCSAAIDDHPPRSCRQLRFCLLFAKRFPNLEIVNTLCSKLSWSHLRMLSGMEDHLKRAFYIELAQLENWSVRQSKECLDSMLYERTAIGFQQYLYSQEGIA